MSRCSRSPRSTGSGSSIPHRRRRSRARTSSTSTGLRSSGAARSSNGHGSPRCCDSRFARCGTAGPVRCTSSCRHRSFTRWATRQTAPVLAARRLPGRPAATVRPPARRGRRAARRRQASGLIAGARRRSRRRARSRAGDRRAAQLPGDRFDGRARERADRSPATTSSGSALLVTCARSEADVLLVAGSRMGNLDVPYDTYWGDPEGKRLIQIDIDPRHIGVTRPLHLGILSDARAALEGIATRLPCGATRARSDGAISPRYRELDEQVRTQHGEADPRVAGPGHSPRTRARRDRRVLRSGRGVHGRRRQHVAVGVQHAAADAPAVVPLDPRARHARHRHPVGDRRQARRTRPRGRLRHRRRRRGLQRHGTADRGARGYRRHGHRVRRGLMDDGGAQRAPAVRHHLRHRARARSAGTSSRKGSAATASTWTVSTTSTARCGAVARTTVRAWSAFAATTTPTSPCPPR